MDVNGRNRIYRGQILEVELFSKYYHQLKPKLIELALRRCHSKTFLEDKRVQLQHIKVLSSYQVR